MGISIDYFVAGGSSGRRVGNATREEVVVSRARGLSSEESATKETIYKVIVGKMIADGRGPGSQHPGDGGMIAQEIAINATGFGGDVFDIHTRYSTATGTTPSVLIIDVDGALQSVEVDKDPISFKPLYLGWEGDIDPGDGGSGGEKVIKPAIPADLAVRPKLRPVVRVSGLKVFYRIQKSDTVVAGAKVIGKVNEAEFLGRPRGAWMMTQYKTTQNRYGGTSALRLEAITKSLDPSELADKQRSEDWRTPIVLRDGRTRRVAQLKPDKMKQYEAAMDAAYAHGIIKGEGDENDYDPAIAGFVVLGDYPVGDFDEYWSSMDLTTTDPPFGTVSAAADPGSGIGGESPPGSGIG